MLDRSPHVNRKLKARNKRRSARKIGLALLFTITLCISGYLLTDYLLEKRSGFIRYPGFGIPIPQDFKMYGIDVSHHQGPISWEAVRNMREGPVRLGFVFIKATEGMEMRDPRFARNWRSAKANGLTRGAYHFFRPDRSGTRQAEHFIENVSLKTGDLPPVLDVEETLGLPRETIRKRVREWLLRVEKHYKVKPIIYASPSFYLKVLGNEFDDYPLWVAHYLRRNRPRIGRDWLFWQFSETGKVNGIRSKVDFNVFKGDSLQFRKLLLP